MNVGITNNFENFLKMYVVSYDLKKPQGDGNRIFKSSRIRIAINLCLLQDIVY